MRLVENRTGTSFLRKTFPKILRATIKSLLYFVILYVVPTLLIAQVAKVAPELLGNYGPLLRFYVAIIIFFVAASELTSGTIFEYGFAIGKTLILIVFFIFALNGGTMELDFRMIHVMIDLRIILGLVIILHLLGLAKIMFQAVNFLSEKAEQQLPSP